jgi:hypothetical protein
MPSDSGEKRYMIITVSVRVTPDGMMVEVEIEPPL